MRILHLAFMRQLSSGQRNQLRYETISSTQLKGVQWDTEVYHSGNLVEPFERSLPAFFRGVFSRNLYAWIVLLRVWKKYDYVICRHMPFDPFAFVFARSVRNRITVHHAKDVEELKLIRPGLRGKLASSLEVVTGKHALRSAVAVLGVTDEIRAYQLETRAVRKKSWVYPNGVVSSEIPLLEDKRDAVTIEAAFICGHFSPWHGLDLLTEELRRASVLRVIPSGLKIHLIGKLSESQIRDVEMANVNQEVFIIHGNLSPSEYVPILTRCDVGIGSLAMFRENLTQGATLKVREYLALGLPVYSGHVDTSIPKTFKYYKCGSISLPQVIDFANSLKAAKRNEVREASAQYIEKLQLMRSVVDWLSGN